MTIFFYMNLYMCTIVGVMVQQIRKYNGTNLKEFLHLEHIHMHRCVSDIKRGNIANKIE